MRTRNTIWAVVLPAIGSLISLPAYAQDATKSPPAPSGTQTVNAKSDARPIFAPLTKSLAPLTVENKTVGEVAAILTKESGILVVADSSVSAKPVSFSVNELPVTDLANGVAKLVPGTTIRFITAPADVSSPDPDMLSQLLRMQEAIEPLKLLKKDTKAAAQTFTEIEVAGRKVPLATAEPLLATLNLRPVVLLTNPNGDNPVAKTARLQAEGLQMYLAMTPEQRLQAAERQIDALFNMDSATRQALFGQMMEQSKAIMNKINSLPAEQRAQFFRDLTGGKFDGTTPPGKGGNGNGQQ